jgi:hypothetical protein
MRRITGVALAVLLVTPAWAQTDPLSPLRFLVGDWVAIDAPAGESGAFSFKPGVQDHVMVRTNEANYTATSERAASRHEDLLVIYPENGSLKTDYFDSEGHVIRYTVQPRQPDGVVFVSDPLPREPRYRLTYSRGTGGLLIGSFEIAPAGAPDAFKPYLSWKARRR